MLLGAELVNYVFCQVFYGVESNLLSPDLHNFSFILIGAKLRGSDSEIVSSRGQIRN
jgi:hypothetical protein